MNISRDGNVFKMMSSFSKRSIIIKPMKKYIKYMLLVLISLTSTYQIASAYIVKNSGLSSSELIFTSIFAIIVGFILIKAGELLLRKIKNNNGGFKDIAGFIHKIGIFLIGSGGITLLINLPIYLSSSNDDKILYQNNSLDNRLNLLNNIDKTSSDIDNNCTFNGKLYRKPINAHCLENDKYNAWLCDNGYYEASGDGEAKGQQVCVNKITNEYMYYQNN
ncbi:MAG: hypothetical protein PHH98_03080 [Candidatus Gracilibacteria bacterium]|nr:hypothetical protein [Candidatus Gracilibacteria bacterium]